MKNTIWKNISEKTIQVPNRISEEFSWKPNERIKITDWNDKFIYVDNIDYRGIYRAMETSIITFDLLFDNFKLIDYEMSK